jgi:hypothetical protein
MPLPFRGLIMPPVNDSALTDLPTLKQWLNLSPLDVGADAPLTRLIISTTGFFKKAINRNPFITSTVTESYRGNGGRRLFLRVQPVTAVLSVLEDGKVLQQIGDLYQNTGYNFDKYGLFSVRWALSSVYEVTYTGGFPLTSDEAYMAEQAVLSIINLWWKRRPHADELARSLGNQITAKYVEDELPPEARAIIQQLKKMN